MASIERTAYPRFPRTLTLKDLQASFTPCSEETEWACRSTAADAATCPAGAEVLSVPAPLPARGNADFRLFCLAQFALDVEAADKACKADDAQGLRRIAHSLKTVLHSLGHAILGGRARQLEELAANGDLDAARACVASAALPTAPPRGIAPVDRRCAADGGRASVEHTPVPRIGNSQGRAICAGIHDRFG